MAKAHGFGAQFHALTDPTESLSISEKIQMGFVGGEGIGDRAESCWSLGRDVKIAL